MIGSFRIDTFDHFKDDYIKFNNVNIIYLEEIKEIYSNIKPI